MDATAVFFLRFDPVSGPVIESVVGSVDFTADDLTSLKSCAFPDTAVPSPADSTIFVFKVRDHYCYSIFTSIPDPQTPRGHRQFSYVIATPLPYVYPFTRLLHSSMSARDMDPSDLLLLLSSFATRAAQVLTDPIGEGSEIPTFDGGLPVGAPRGPGDLLDLVAGIGWTPQCRRYLTNTCFVGQDLSVTLSAKSLAKRGRMGDILRLWEASVLGESVMVLGATPTAACAAVFAIASLTFPEPPPEHLLPFVAATDPRFEAVTASPSAHERGVIAGFSNPIAAQRADLFDLTFTVGFGADRDGLATAMRQWRPCEGVECASLRRAMYLNVCRVVEGVRVCLEELEAANPYSAYVGQVDPQSMARHFERQGVETTMGLLEFVRKFLRAPMFARIWRERATPEKLLAALRRFSVDSLCTGRTEHELIDLFSMVMHVRRICSGNKEIEKVIEADLTTITLYLSTDLILAPPGSE